MLSKKQVRVWVRYLLLHVLTAIIGIVLFPASIYHIFFSYRGAGAAEGSMNIIEALQFYASRLCEAFSVNNVLIIALLALAAIAVVVRLGIRIVKKEKICKLAQYVLIALPTLLYFVVVAKIAPDVEAKYAVRYVMPILPEIAIIFVLALYRVFSSKVVGLSVTAAAVVIISVNGMITNEPKYLYRGYQNYLDIAEEYKDLDFVYAVDNAFTQLTSLPEFAIYNKSLIINMNYDLSLIHI